MSAEITLRGYQSATFDELRSGVAQRQRVQLVCAPTGSGKSVLATYLMKLALEKQSPTWFLVDRIALVDQVSAMLDHYGVPHGVIQADHWRMRTYEPIQVISTGTLARRDLAKLAAPKLIIMDEAHIVIAAFLRLLDAYPDAKIVGLTATPFTRGLGNIYGRIINVVTTNRLIAEGWLAPLKVYAARKIDMRGAKVMSTGEWEPTEIEKRSTEIIGDLVDGWVGKTELHYGGKVKTLVFSATVPHGDELCRQYQARGYNFQQLSYKDGERKKRDLIKEFRKHDSEVDGLVSCEVLGRGFDVPDVRCLVSARPYRKSLSSWVQQIGRGMRPAEGKADCLLLDHGGNWIRFIDDLATFFEEGVSDLSDKELDSKTRKEDDEATSDHACKKCGFVMLATDVVCPMCGTERPKRKNKQGHVDGELVAMGLDAAGRKRKLADFLQDKASVQRQIWGLALHRKNGDRPSAEKFALAQYRSIYNEWPRRAFRNIEPESCSYEVHQRIKSRLIAYAKAKENSA